MLEKRMVCGLVVGKQLVHIGVSSAAPGARLKAGGQNQSMSRHAEMDALRYLRRHPDARKASLVVGRLVGSSAYGNSGPCLHCIRRILRFHPQIVAVTFYEDGKWTTQRPEVCAESSKLSAAERNLCH